MNTANLAALIGHFYFHRLSSGINYFCKIIDAKHVYGITKVLIVPVQGSGEAWVNLIERDRADGATVA